MEKQTETYFVSGKEAAKIIGWGYTKFHKMKKLDAVNFPKTTELGRKMYKRSDILAYRENLVKHE